jgi:hypothetical protein
MSTVTLSPRHIAALAWSLLGHIAAIIVGFVLMVVGLALGVTMIMLPVGVAVGLLGFLLLVGGFFAHVGRAHRLP